MKGLCNNVFLWRTAAGNDFSSAKELKAEMKAVYQEQERLEALVKRLHSLSSGSSQELARMKEHRQQLRKELEHREVQHGESVCTQIRLLSPGGRLSQEEEITIGNNNQADLASSLLSKTLKSQQGYGNL